MTLPTDPSDRGMPVSRLWQTLVKGWTMARTLKNAGQECWAVYDGDRLIARIVPHDTGAGWKGVDLNGNALTTQSCLTPELVLEDLPAEL